MDNPFSLSQEIAKLLEADPVATAQVKEHIKPERLAELLDIVPETSPEKLRELDCDGCQMIDRDEALSYVLSRYTKTELLARINNS